MNFLDKLKDCKMSDAHGLPWSKILRVYYKSGLALSRRNRNRSLRKFLDSFDASDDVSCSYRYDDVMDAHELYIRDEQLAKDMYLHLYLSLPREHC